LILSWERHSSLPRSVFVDPNLVVYTADPSQPAFHIQVYDVIGEQ
jgi:hypothetical protein